jgi:hypothetical protein
METRIRTIVPILVLATGLVLATSAGSWASCADDDPDGSLVAAARATAEANCAALGRGCTNAASHGQYVSCIAHEVNTLSSGDTPTLPRSCKGAVKKCAAHSVCGKQSKGFATCCVTNATGEVTCKTGRSDHCSGVVGTCGSCCDACGGGTGPTCPAG